MGIEKSGFGHTKSGQEAFLYTITNKNGNKAAVTDFGATLVSVEVKDKQGKMRDLVLGYDTAAEYEENGTFFGAVVGRSGNRIDNARFVINDKNYRLEQNENENNLHSGTSFYSKRYWSVSDITEDSVSFTLDSPDMDQGYPGNFKICLSYRWTDENELIIHYQGESDQDTVANMTNHTYFNLDGHDSGLILKQSLQLFADYFTPVKDSKSIPTGVIKAVAQTPMDFTAAKSIGKDIADTYEQLQFTGGYDHNYVVKEYDHSVRIFAKAAGVESGISMEAYTDLPGFQFYAGNFLKTNPGKHGCIYNKRQGFCLETQYFPNAINEPAFESPLLKAGKEYNTTTVYKFLV